MILSSFDPFDFSYSLNQRTLTSVMDPQKQAPEELYKKVLLKNFTKLKETPVSEFVFLINLHISALQLYEKRYSDTGVLQLILQKFVRTLFLQNTSGRLLLDPGANGSMCDMNLPCWPLLHRP